MKSECSVIVIDNFYENPLEVREFALSQEFHRDQNHYPGNRSKSFANEQIRLKFDKYVSPFTGQITSFNTSRDYRNVNGAFQYTTSKDRSWIHRDSDTEWAAVIYLTPDAPLSSGTGFYIPKSQDTIRKPYDITAYDITKWDLVDRIGNVFNRLILFNSKRYHSSMDYFGNSPQDGRLFQVFFFSCEQP